MLRRIERLLLDLAVIAVFGLGALITLGMAAACLGMATVASPAMLVLDEPLSGLDQDGQQEMLGLMNKFNLRCTSVSQILNGRVCSNLILIIRMPATNFIGVWSKLSLLLIVIIRLSIITYHYVLVLKENIFRKRTKLFLNH